VKKILLVEDDPLIVEIYTRKLREEGFEVEVAEDGEIALSKLKEKDFNLLVLDIVLPYLTGFEALRKIRKEPKLKDLKVLVLSNLGQKSDIERASELGVLRYLIKAHYSPSEVVEEIKKLLK